MDIAIDYTPGAGPAAVYLRQRNNSGKYANFTTLEWDTAESADTKAWFSEPDPVNAAGFFVVTVAPIPGKWRLEAIEATSGLKIFEGETEAAEPVTPPTLAEIRAAISLDHGPGLYGPGVAAEYAIHVTTVISGSDPAIPIPDVAVSLLNADESVALDQRRTDSMGNTVFPANNGTYVIRHRLAGYSFDDDAATIDNADSVHICPGIAYVSPVQQIPGMQILMIIAKEFGRDVWAAGDPVEVTIEAGQTSGGVILRGRTIKGILGIDGVAEIGGVDGIPVDIGVKIKVAVGSYYSRDIITDATPVKNVTEYPL